MFLCCVVVWLVACAALRVKESVARAEDWEKKYTVEVALTLVNPTAVNGSAVEFALNGVRHFTRIHPTQTGSPVVLHHVPRGSVVTAHEHASGEACAHWIGAGVKNCRVGDWQLAFATSDEGDQQVDCDGGASYEAYVDIVGKAGSLKVEVNHAEGVTYNVQPKQKLLYPGLQRGALVKVVSATGSTCTYLVGDKETMCNLDDSWGLRIGSVEEFEEDERDENVHPIDVREYMVDLALGFEEETGHSEVIEIELNGDRIAWKNKATEPGESIILHHVKSGSVLTAISHLTGEACGIYVGAVEQTKTCAGWILTYKSEEENDATSEDNEYFDVSYSVQRGSTTPTGAYNIDDVDGWFSLMLETRDTPIFFPLVAGGWSRGTKLAPDVNHVVAENCFHVVGGAETKCEHGGWVFTMSSRLNRNYFLKRARWDWNAEENVQDKGGFETGYKFTVTATDSTKSKSRLECTALDKNLTFVTLDGKVDIHIEKKKPLFEPKYLVAKKDKCATKDAITVNSATFAGEINGHRQLFGFGCTVYNENGKMCQADTNGMSTTLVQGCTLHIEIHRVMTLP